MRTTESDDADGKTRISHAISIDERFCRGDWGAPKSEASNATIGINACVYDRIQRLRLLTVDVRAGNAVRHYKVVKSNGPDDLVFQSVRTGAPIISGEFLNAFACKLVLYIKRFPRSFQVKLFVRDRLTGSLVLKLFVGIGKFLFAHSSKTFAGTVIRSVSSKKQ